MEETNKKVLKIADLGEFGLINHLTSGFNIKNSETVQSI